MDTWWQTETGGILISPLPGAIDLKPGSATKPFFGISPALVDNEGNKLEGEAEGNLILETSWPGQMKLYMVTINVLQDTIFLLLIILISQVMEQKEMLMAIGGLLEE